ncbi:MAG: hypothetical protein E7022_03055 [Desulfovibrio desulfuricans]|nr:hypothetical protein [Desulfovibrio desulfuricans]
MAIVNHSSGGKTLKERFVTNCGRWIYGFIKRHPVCGLALCAALYPVCVAADIVQAFLGHGWAGAARQARKGWAGAVGMWRNRRIIWHGAHLPPREPKGEDTQ